MNTTRKLTFTAIFAAIAAVIMFFEFPLPFMPPFLKVDLSGAVILVGALLFGPGPAVGMALVKDIVHLLSTQTGGSGELADFLMTATLVLITYAIFQHGRTKRWAVLGCVCGSAVMSLMGVLTNKLIIIPFYAMIMPIDSIISACAEINPLIGSMNGYLLFGVLPFNLIKGAILSIITLLLYERLANVLHSIHIGTLQKTNQ